MSKRIIGVVLLVLVAIGVEAVDVASPKEVVQAIYRDVFNKHDVAPLDQLLIEDFVDHNADPGQQPGRAGVKGVFENMFKAFPDLHVEPEQILVDGNFVAARLTFTGTQEADFLGMPASHKAISVTLIDIIEVKDGKATQRWGLMDTATMMDQMVPMVENVNE